MKRFTKNLFSKNCILLFFCSILFCIPLFAQQAKITLNKKNISVNELLSDIRKQTGVDFVSFSTRLEKLKTISPNFQQADLFDVLDQYFNVQSGVVYLFKNNSLVLLDEEKAKKRNVKGKVINAKTAKPMPGVTVSFAAKNLSVRTEQNGEFSIEIPEYARTLHVGFIGYQKNSIHITSAEEYVISLSESTEDLEEVVVTGIFERKAESFTGAATVIQHAELMQNGSQNLLQNLKNIDPSFRIVENMDFGSDPNRMPDIQLRGQQSIPDIKGSFNGNPNQPLFILDGFETDISTVFDLDLNRIQTVVLLKDAAAKAIYGAKAANGVVVIETRKPIPGKLKISYKGDLNFTIPDLNGYNLTNAMEKYVVERDNPSSMDRFFREQYLNKILAEVQRGVDTYWLSKPLHIGTGHKQSVYLEGGDEKIRYGVDLMYNNINGVMKGSQRNTFTGGFTLSYRFNKVLIRNQFNTSLNKAVDSPYGSFSDYVMLNPYWTPYDDQGNLKQILGSVGGGGMVESIIGNPLWNGQVGTKNFSNYTTLTNNLYMEWEILNSLRLVSRLGLTKNQNSRDDFFPAAHTKFANYTEDRFFERGTYDQKHGGSLGVRADVNANYSFRSGGSQFFINTGLNMQENSGHDVTYSVVGFPNDKMDFIAAGKEYLINAKPYGNQFLTREVGGLTALNYSYNERFLADLSYRITGSSMFGKEKRWGQFWSAGLGWNLHNEPFLKNIEGLKQLKLRGSTGFTGAQNFNPFQALATFGYYQSQVYDNWMGSYLLGLPNNDLKWQKTQDFNLGFDMNLFDKLIVRYDYYVQNTKDQLLDLTVPPSMGFMTYKENLGNTENKGMELKLSSHLIQKPETNSYMNVFLTVGTNKNQIKKISNALKSYNDDNDNQLGNGNFNQVRKPLLHFVEGQSMNAIWTVRSLGIDPGTGEEIFLTKDGQITNKWNPADQVVTGDAMPKYNGNFGVNMQHHGVFLNLSFNYQMGGQIYNQTLVDRVENADLYFNVDKRIYDAIWKKPDDHVSFAFNRYKATKPSSRFVQDLNELRLSVLNVGYDFRNSKFLKRIKLEQLKTSFYMNDVFRVSSVKVERGLEYPFARTYSFSVSTTF